MSKFTVSTVLTTIDESITVLMVLMKEETSPFKRGLLKNALNALKQAEKQCKIIKKINSYPEEVFVIENGIARKAKTEDIFRMLRNEEELL